MFYKCPLIEDYQYIGYDEFLKEEDTHKIDETRDRSIQKNSFRTKPLGIIIQDTYNNFAFPVRPYPRIDNNKENMLMLVKRFRELYMQFDSKMLPWHFVIEMVKDRYFVHNTRPLSVKYPLSHMEVMNLKENVPFGVEWNSETTEFMERRIFDIDEAIHVCIMGDSSTDVYGKNFYKTMGQFCIRPFLYYFKLPQTSKTRTFALNTGDKFNYEYLFKFLYK